MSMTQATTLSARILTALCVLAPTLVQVGCSPAQDDTEASLAAADPTDDARRRRAGGVYASQTLYVEGGSHAEVQAGLWRGSDPDGAAIMDVLADQPVSTWIGDWTSNPTATVDAALDRAGAQLQTFVVYNIPNRDCGAWSAGGVADAAAYADFIDEVAAGLAGRLAIVVLEPDALALVDCLDGAGEAARLDMMSDAVDTLSAAGAAVYLDAGDSNWIPSAEMAGQLLAAGVQNAAGFALNVSHTEFSANEIAYAEEIRAIVGNSAHYVIDSSRNGLGPTADNQWCNPLGRASGHLPTLRTGAGGLDAMLWVKPPGESDGSCNGGPVAGAWWPEYARDLGELAGF
jgi:endoglucanase